MGEVVDPIEVSYSSEGEVNPSFFLALNQNKYNSHSKRLKKDTNQGSSAQSEPERIARKAQYKMTWENPCQRQFGIGIMCGDKPWNQADPKTVSASYLSLGTEGRIIVYSRNPHLRNILTTVELWCMMEEVFIRPRCTNQRT